jgi:hypothetical protein
VASPAWTAFQASFRVSAQSAEISRLLAQHTALRALHTRLVPAALPQETFWLHYFYAVHQLDAEDQRRRTVLDSMGTACAPLFTKE